MPVRFDSSFLCHCCMSSLSVTRLGPTVPYVISVLFSQFSATSVLSLFCTQCLQWYENSPPHLKIRSHTWVKEGGGGHPARLLLVVQQLVTGLKVLVTVLAVVLPLFCTVGERDISLLCIWARRLMPCRADGRKCVFVRCRPWISGAMVSHEYSSAFMKSSSSSPGKISLVTL